MKTKSIQVHRFRDDIALSFIGNSGETVYISSVVARELVKAIQAGINDLKDNPEFSRSTMMTYTINPRLAGNIKARRVEPGKWHGYYMTPGGRWKAVRSQYGIIKYMSKTAALNGAAHEVTNGEI